MAPVALRLTLLMIRIINVPTASLAEGVVLRKSPAKTKMIPIVVVMARAGEMEGIILALAAVDRLAQVLVVFLIAAGLVQELICLP